MNFSKWAILRQCSGAGMTRYTKKAQSVVFCAYEYASRSGVQQIRLEHLLLGIIASDKSLAIRVNLPSADLISSVFNVAECEQHADSRPMLSEAARCVMSYAAEERERLGHVHTGTEHLLLGIMRGKGDVADFLQGQGVSVERVLQIFHLGSVGSLSVVEPATT